MSLRPEQIRESNDICRALRNAAAHHNSFTPGAIQGRKDGGNVVCRYDTLADPYAAMSRDAEKVALLLGDEVAAREIRLSFWAADASVSSEDMKREGPRCKSGRIPSPGKEGGERPRENEQKGDGVGAGKDSFWEVWGGNEVFEGEG